MKGFLKFLILAVAGFALGAGAAWLQQPHSVTPPPFPSEKIAKPSPVAEDAKPESKPEATPEAAPEEEAAAPEEAIEAPVKEASSELTAPAEEAGSLTSKEPDSAPGAPPPKEAPPEIAGNIAAAKGEPPPVGANIGGAFSMTDHDGKAVTEKSWPGKYLLVFFGFTNCPDVCPVTLDKLTSALNQLGDDASKVQTLFISVDPGRDRAPVLKEYVGHFHKSILGLTGTPEQVKATQDAYKIYASRHDDANGHDYTFDHSAFVYFMTPEGKMAEVIRSGDKAGDIADKLKPYLAAAPPEGDKP
ncbi:MAG: SCO family protein [Alphaproteobacteria bacterium]|nr:MAG: SCO family protein [Alphaproteobacteria bacterium]